MEGLSEKSIISPDYFYLFCAFSVSCIGSADFVPPDLPTSSLSKKKKSHFGSNRDTISLEVCYWGRPKYKYKLRC